MPSQVTNVASDDALTAIYRLEYDEEGEVIAARLAERLEITAPSMSAMLRRLERDQLIALGDRKRVSLTAQGLARAEEMIRRHRLAECLLVHVLGLEWWQAYEEAHLLEHAISPVTEPLIDRRLGHPTHSPFGYVIPRPRTHLPRSTTTVADLPVGATSEVERVFEEDQELLRYFDDAGVRPGVPVTIQAHSPVGGTLDLSVSGRDMVVGSHVARRIWVRPCASADAPYEDRRQSHP